VVYRYVIFSASTRWRPQDKAPCLWHTHPHLPGLCSGCCQAPHTQCRAVCCTLLLLPPVCSCCDDGVEPGTQGLPRLLSLLLLLLPHLVQHSTEQSRSSPKGHNKAKTR